MAALSASGLRARVRGTSRGAAAAQLGMDLVSLPRSPRRLANSRRGRDAAREAARGATSRQRACECVKRLVFLSVAASKRRAASMIIAFSDFHAEVAPETASKHQYQKET